MTTTTPRDCVQCGKTMAGKYARICGNCVKRLTASARQGQHAYTRTHVHEWPDGHRTMELGVRCDGSDHESAREGITS